MKGPAAGARRPSIVAQGEIDAACPEDGHTGGIEGTRISGAGGTHRRGQAAPSPGAET